MQLFRALSHEEETSFRQWAQANYKPLTPINGTWHPVIQDECCRINQEAGNDFIVD